jgi:hypothetical protein
MQVLRIKWKKNIWHEPLEYHWYCALHFISNFNGKFKDLFANNV